MITDLRILLAQVADRMAEAVAPLKNALPIDMLVEQPLGEYPDVPAGVAAAANPRQQDSTGGHPNTAALIIDRHYARLKPVRKSTVSFWVCDCGQFFEFRLAHAEHVADLIFSST